MHSDSRQLLYLLKAPVIIVDGEGMVRLVNDAALALLGERREVVEARSVDEQPWRLLALDGRELEAAQRPYKLLLAGMMIEHMRLILEISSGERRVVEFSGVCVSETEALFTINDISELYAAREALLAQERHLLEAQSIARVGSWHFDIPTRKLSWSPQVFHLLGLDPTGPSPSFDDFLHWIPDEERELWMATVRPTFEDGRAYEIAHRLILPDGSVRHVLSRGEGRRDERGLLIGVSGTAQDVTTQYVNEQQRIALLRELHEAERLRSIGLLAGGIAHDFNNLLAGIVGNVSFLLDELKDKGYIFDALNDISKAARQMVDLTNNLLAYAGKSKSKESEINLFEALRETYHVTRLTLKSHCELKLIEPPVPFMVRVDPGHLRQILLNVVINAADAVRERRDGVIEISMAHHARCEGLDANEHGFVCLTIQDNGMGMDDQTLKRIFEPFFTTKPGGRGLGLSAVQGFIRSMGGTVRVDSVIDQGTRFQIFLPLVACAIPVAHAQLSELSEASCKSVLVIDDEVLVRNVCQRILEREGILVHAASGGEEALRWLAAQHNSPPDLVILDMMMPGMDGLEVFEVLRHRYEGMKFILMSGFTEESLVALEQHREEISFLQKPFYPDDLRRLIKRLLG